MKTQLQLIATTIALTVLIWVYADQSAYEYRQTTVLVRYVPPAQPDNPYVVHVIDNHGEAKEALRVELTFRGPKSAIRQLEKDETTGRFNLAVVLGDELKPGPQPSRDVYDDLIRLTEVRNRGLTLQHVDPPTVQLDVDRYHKLPVQLEVSAGSFAKALDGPIRIQPEKVEARVLETQMPEDNTLPPLKVSIESLLKSRAEQVGDFSFDVPLHSSWPGIEANFIPEQIRVTVRLGRPTTIERVNLIPLGVLVEPQNFFGKYGLEWQDQTGAQFTQTVDVRVPLTKVGQLKGNMIDAYVTVLDTDLPKELPVTSAPSTQASWLEREIHFVLPPDFQDARIEGAPKTVKFRIRKLAELGSAISPTHIPIPTVAP